MVLYSNNSAIIKQQEFVFVILPWWTRCNMFIVQSFGSFQSIWLITWQQITPNKRQIQCVLNSKIVQLTQRIKVYFTQCPYSQSVFRHTITLHRNIFYDESFVNFLIFEYDKLFKLSASFKSFCVQNSSKSVKTIETINKFSTCIDVYYNYEKSLPLDRVHSSETAYFNDWYKQPTTRW